MSRELSKVFYGCFGVRVSGIFWAIIVPKTYVFTLKPYAGAPPSGSTLVRYAFQSGLRVRPDAPIKAILLLRRLPQILKSIIISQAVDMIQQTNRPTLVNVEKSEVMSFVPYSSNGNHEVSSLVQAPGRSVKPAPWRYSFLPKEMTCCVIIFQKLSKSLVRNLFSHVILLMMIMTSVSGCSSTGFIATNAQVCDVWKPIYPSRKDVLTDGTKGQIAGNNAANESLCGARPPPKPKQRVASNQ